MSTLLAQPAAETATGVAIYTYGWDTAFAIPVPEVNKAIVDHSSSPKGFDVREPSFTVSGQFSDWQVCPGGDGKEVRLVLPLRDVKLVYTATGKEFDFPSGQAVVGVQLHYIPHTGDPTATGKPVALVVRDTAPSTTTPAFTVMSVSLTPAPGTVTGALVEQGLSDWGNANLALFAHVFSVVDINRMVDQGQWGFVTPNYTSYAYLDGSAPENSVLAVLTMTGNRTGEALSEQVSAAAIPSGSVAGFVVSQARTLYDLVRPAIKQAYPGLTDSNFLMNDDATELYLTNGTSISLKPVTHDGTTYYPQLKALTIKSVGQILTLQSYTETEIVAGITATATATHWYTLSLGTSNNGQALLFNEAQPPDIVHDIHQSEGSQITQIIITIVAAIVLVILTILTDGAALIVGGLIVGLVMGANMAVPAIIEKVNHDDSPSVDLLLVNAVDPIKWTASTTFKLDYASLNVSMQLGGNPLFV